MDHEVGALSGGIARFVFGREVINASRAVSAEAPAKLPVRLALTVKLDARDDDLESNRAFATLEDAPKTTGTWLAGTAGASISTATASRTEPKR